MISIGRRPGGLPGTAAEWCCGGDPSAVALASALYDMQGGKPAMVRFGDLAEAFGTSTDAIAGSVLGGVAAGAIEAGVSDGRIVLSLSVGALAICRAAFEGTRSPGGKQDFLVRGEPLLTEGRTTDVSEVDAWFDAKLAGRDRAGREDRDGGDRS